MYEPLSVSRCTNGLVVISRFGTIIIIVVRIFTCAFCVVNVSIILLVVAIIIIINILTIALTVLGALFTGVVLVSIAPPISVFETLATYISGQGTDLFQRAPTQMRSVRFRSHLRPSIPLRCSHIAHTCVR